MAKLSRSAFLYSLGATSALLLAGCGSGTTKNTSYGGAYRSAYTIAQTGETGLFNFTVDTKGNITGSLDNQGGKVREVSGTLKSDGSFTADTFDRGANVRGQLSGIMSGGASVLAPGALPTATPITGGNFSLSEGTTRSSGSFLVGGTPPASGTSGFQGFYNGVYNIPELNQNGTTSFSVDAAGNMTGSLTRADETGLLTGLVAGTGSFTASIKFRTETTQFQGTLIKTTDNSTLGNFTETIGGRAVAGSFGPTTVKTGDSVYKGSYRGTYSLPEQNETGNVSFTVDPSGALTGFFSQNNNSPVGLFTGAFQNTGRFTGTVTYDAASGLTPRPITGRLGTSTVSGKLSGDFVFTINGANLPGNFEVSVGASEPDSIFRGSFSSTSDVGPTFRVTVGGDTLPVDTISRYGQISFTVDKQGELLGSIQSAVLAIDKDGNVVATSRGKAMVMRARLSNDGRMSGTISEFVFDGKLSKQVVPIERTASVTTTPTPGPSPSPGASPTPSPSPSTTPGEVRTSPGVAGNMEIAINGAKYIATFFAAGGFTGGTA